jgi:colanic acid/amylovoran biosynthesis glycosyltransferase
MKIGIVLSTTPGYSETFFTSKIKGLQSNGIEVILFVQRKSNDFNLCKVVKFPKVYKKYPLFQIGLFVWVFLGLIPCFSNVWRYVKLEQKQRTSFSQTIKNIYLNSTLLKQQLDWLHFGFATQAIGSELVAKAIGAKMAVSFRGFDIAIYPLKNNNCYQLLWRQLDKVHTISDDLLNLAYDLGLPNTIPVEKITPAIDASFFSASKKVFNIPSNKIRMLSIARLHWKKGFIEVLEALSILNKKGYDFEYRIVGGGIENERIAYAIHQLNLQDKVFLLGKMDRDKVVKEYAQSHLFIQYSISEGFCNAVLEAQSMGLLCIVSDAEGLSENVIHHKTGWVVPKYQPEALATKMIEIFELSELEKQQISQNAINRVKNLFTIEQQQLSFVNFYKGS